MATEGLCILGIIAFFSLLLSSSFADDDDIRAKLQTYIVHVQEPKYANLGNADALESWYRSFLPETINDTVEPRLIYSYGSAISGFAARLTKEELKITEVKEGFISAYPDRNVPLLTTHTPEFLGLQPEKGLWRDSSLGEGVIIGVLDSGVVPEHPSFDDSGMPPPPSKWKGSCHFQDFKCNKKIIGAKMFVSNASTVLLKSLGDAEAGPYDTDGHGTHTASTAAGNFVKNAHVVGNANGTAAGVAPHAHLAIYKVCGVDNCRSIDVLAGIDAAIKDGVDILSISLGGDDVPYFNDGIAIGAFSAMKKGIFVSCGAGNSGPEASTLSNTAPWILTVGASTMDRSISARVKLGNKQEFDGQSLHQPTNFSSINMYPLILPSRYNANDDCQSLEDVDIKGKIVLCNNRGDPRGKEVKYEGGAGMILCNDAESGYTVPAINHAIPASYVSYLDGVKIREYANSTDKPAATIMFKGTIVGKSPAPTVASFSSRGPSEVSPGISKPDVVGPGVDILAAWLSYSRWSTTANGKATFAMLSGTSMSTPHLSGVAALLKRTHPDWSPAAIKSAIMTSSEKYDRRGEPIKDEKLQHASFYAMGAGHVNPAKANDPGLIYDLEAEDYIPYLCGLGLTDKQVRVIVRENVSCSKLKHITEAELNYPSITVSLRSGSAEVKRIVTNVGEANSTYSLEVEEPKIVEVSVEPRELRFSRVNEKQSFIVSFKIGEKERFMQSVLEGNINWVSGKRKVRSPVIIKF